MACTRREEENLVRQNTNGDIVWFQFESLLSLGDTITHGVFARHGGVSLPPYSSLNAGPATRDDLHAKMENYSRISAALPGHPLLVGTPPLQGSEILEITNDLLGAAQPPALLLPGGCDAFITRAPGIGLFWAVADCAVILLVDSRRRAIGLAHAGWRGARDAIVIKTLRRMEEVYGTDAADLHAAIGPTIGPYCYEVDERLRMEFAQNAFANAHAQFSVIQVEDEDGATRSSLRLDLAQSNRAQLIAAGVPEDCIEMSGLCTGTRRDLFFSHRMEHGRTGRFAVVLGLR
jgi:polyphenol oxidase